MSSKLLNEIKDITWGCEFQQLSIDSAPANIHVCLVKVNSLPHIATECISTIADSTWISKLDPRTARGYRKTAGQTASVLIRIFNDFIAGSNSSKVGADFGEMMVSIGSAAALASLLRHKSLPVAELWKPQVKQNEGFDFHTECGSPFINFGEAKFSDSASPHGLAIPQIKRFIEEEKHYRDRVHLINIAMDDSIENFDMDKFGVVASFSINGKDPEVVLTNAVKSSIVAFKDMKLEHIYLVGVVHK